MGDSLRELLKNCSDHVLAMNAELLGSPEEDEKKRNKFNATPVVVDGEGFDSRLEARVILRLRQLEQAGEITDLEPKPVYVLLPGFKMASGERVAPMRFRPDFRYRDRDGVLHIGDAKGQDATVTEAFRLKWKLLKHLHRDDPNVVFEIVVDEDLRTLK